MEQLTCTSCGIENPGNKLACTACGADLPHPTLRPPSTDMLHEDTAPGDHTDTRVRSASPNHLGDRYQLREVLGEGGWGIVYRAYDLKLREEIAIKILKSSLSTTPGEVERFKREIVTARKITHPNVIRIHEYGEAGPDVYISMELLEGGTLADKLERGLIPIPEAVKLAAELAEGLQAAHVRDIIHRDIKPQNIMFDETGTAKLVDFGIARLQGTLTQTQGYTGTPYYMSPEQAEGRRVTTSSDLYALGVVLFEMFTGELPFRANSLVRMALMHSTQRVPQPRAIRREIPEFVDQIILCCLEKKAEHRPASAGELAAALRAGLVGLDAGKKVKPTLRPRKKPPVWAFVAGALVLGVFAAAGARELLRGNATPSPATPNIPLLATTVTVTPPTTPVSTKRKQTPRPTPPARVVKKGRVIVKIRPHGYFTWKGHKTTVNNFRTGGTTRIPAGRRKLVLYRSGSTTGTSVRVKICAGKDTIVIWRPRTRKPPTVIPGC